MTRADEQRLRAFVRRVASTVTPVDDAELRRIVVEAVSLVAFVERLAARKRARTRRAGARGKR